MFFGEFFDGFVACLLLNSQFSGCGNKNLLDAAYLNGASILVQQTPILIVRPGVPG